MKVLVLGADGFLGRHICFALRRRGWQVTASARRTAGLARMGFATFPADLSDPATHAPDFWREPLAGSHLVIAAGLLTGHDAAFRAVHVAAPRAALAARPAGHAAVLVSAVGIDAAETPFARWRRQAEAMAAEAGAVILRPGLVIADTSYGGSSLLRALAALPLVTPLAGDGAQRFNPVHAEDLAAVVAACLADPPGPGPWEVGGPEVLTLRQMTAALRGWLGLGPARVWQVPRRLARAIGRAGDALAMGPVSSTALAQLDAGVLADPAPLAARRPVLLRGMSEVLAARPAGTQDLWQARLYLLRPAIRIVLAAMWLVSGLLGLFLPAASFLPGLSGGMLADPLLVAAARAGGVVDLLLAAALLRNLRPRAVALAQIAVVLGYTAGLTLIDPALWLAPFGELLKNLPVLALLLVHLALAEER